MNTTTSADNGSITFGLETIIHDLSIQVQMTNQDIKSNRAKIKILKEILNEKVD
jgi:hypothetical protein